MRIDLSKKNLQTLPNIDEVLINEIKELNLFDNDLIKIPEEIFEMTSMEVLKIEKGLPLIHASPRPNITFILAHF
ncbi:hypothetical protein ACQKMI_10125 [Lysinibacillus sp. NPDC097214]|uniref:hypothetical protein n=1 Tax=Lysinibacillus sp. NPDC097214 TaxID=3390584 RepID=UPI003D0898E1